MNAFIHSHTFQARAASILNLALGTWLIASPWVFDYNGKVAIVSSVFTGSLIALLAASRLTELRDTWGLSCVNVLLGLFTVASPWICGYTQNSAGTNNSIIVGIAVALLAIWSARCILVADPAQ
jgi:uncharacterized membrane protein (UPF0136 family)